MEQALSREEKIQPQKETKSLAALIPAYNAGETVGAVVRGTGRFVKTVLVVDDGSEDDTGKAAADAGALIITHENRMGKGEALKTGIQALMARGAGAVLTLDADGQHDPDDIPALVRRYRQGDVGIVVGSRMAERHRIPRYRLIPNLVGNFFLSHASGQTIEDSQSGMRIYDCAVFKKITLTTSRFDTEAEAIIKAGKAGFRIAFVPIKTIYSERQESNFVPVRDTYLISIVYLRSLFWEKKIL
jgi:glycosyltransferase involved in cell wall biosynthesis